MPLDKYAGNYANDMYGKIRVADEGGHLVLRYSSMLVGDMEHWQYDTFRTTWRDEVANEQGGAFFVTFNLDEKGNAKELNMIDVFTFERVPESQTKEKALQP